jgi:hypothetical protein
MKMIATQIIMALATCAIAYFAWAQHRYSIRVTKSHLFLELRRQYDTVRNRLPDAFRKKGWHDLTDEERRSMDDYWFHSFYEWYASNILFGGQHRDLWREFYRPAVVAGLRHRCMREAFRDLHQRTEFSGYKDRYFGDLDAAYRSPDNRFNPKRYSLLDTENEPH